MLDWHDPVSSATHLSMALWMLFVVAFLARRASLHPPICRASLAFYGLAVVALYSFSGLYHGVYHTSPDTRRVWQLLDQSAIFWLIVASNLPVLCYSLKRRYAQRFSVVLIAVAFGGTLALWLLPKPPHDVLVAIYLTLGILGLLPIRTYFRLYRWSGLFWIILLSIAYVGGAVTEAIRWPILIPGWVGPHELLHIFNMVGTMAHLIFLFHYVMPLGDYRFAKSLTKQPRIPSRKNAQQYES